MKQIILLLALFVAGFAAGWHSRGRQLAAAGEVVETRIDTVYYERPQPIALTSRPITVNVPRLLFAGEHVKDSCKSFTYGSANVKETAEVVAYSATTPYGEQCANNAQSYGSCSEIPDNCAPAPSPGSCSFPSPAPERADSVQIALEVETRTYEDSLYRAQVSGPALGDLGPSLDWIELYNRTQTITRPQTRRNRFALTAGVGAAYTPRGIQPTVGVHVGVVLWGF